VHGVPGVLRLEGDSLLTWAPNTPTGTHPHTYPTHSPHIPHEQPFIMTRLGTALPSRSLLTLPGLCYVSVCPESSVCPVRVSVGAIGLLTCHADTHVLSVLGSGGQGEVLGVELEGEAAMATWAIGLASCRYTTHMDRQGGHN
jgi:hypothetical protein